MGGMLGGGSSGSVTGNPYTSELGNLAALQTGYGNDFVGSGLNQYQGGVAGNLTPAENAMLGYGLGQSDLNTQGTYSNLGLGGSTMESQDMAANQLRSTAEQYNMNMADEAMGLRAAGVGQALLGGAGQDLGGAGTQYQQGYNTTKNGITSLLGGSGGSGGILSSVLGGSSAGGGTGSSGTGGIISNLLGNYAGSSSAGSAIGGTALQSSLDSMYGTGSASALDQVDIGSLLSGA